MHLLVAAMTPREPDRYEAKARELFRSLVMDEARAVPVIAAALRNAPDAALEEAARALDSHRYINASKIVRALASPVAAPAGEKVTPELLAAHAADLAAGRHDLNGAYGCSICGTSPSEPAAPAPDFFADHSDAEVQAALDDVRGKPAAPAPDLRNQRNRFEECAQLFAEIRGDWTDPRDACREGRKLCMEALAEIDAALAARAATTQGEGK